MGQKYTTKKPFKVFISHSSNDIAYVKPIVEMFEHIGLDESTMFCSSVDGYNIPLDANIYDYLKTQFKNYNLRVIFVLSDNYYKSAASLNEMGAAWVLQHNYTSILLPKFDFKDIKGVIDQMRISIKLDSDIRELRPRLNELRDKMIIELGLNDTTASRFKWERHRDDFIEKINALEAGCGSLDGVAVKATENIVRINVNGDSYTGNAKNESLGSRNTFNGPVYFQ